MTGQLPPPDWYPDPADPKGSRWWDGQQWTDYVQPPPVPPSSASAAPVVGRSLLDTSSMSPSSSVAQPLVDRYYDPAPRPWWKKKRYMIPAGVLSLASILSAFDDPDDRSDVDVVALVDSPDSTADVVSTSVLAPATASTASSLLTTVTTVAESTTTTAAPTTAAPSTAAPTTAAPTTAAPSTAAPTTAAPTTSTTAPAPYYANCTEARDAGAAPLYKGDPGYRSKLDRDGDGVACET